jgi:uncharacterized membrane protein SpoIIM required for sporulation
MHSFIFTELIIFIVFGSISVLMIIPFKKENLYNLDSNVNRGEEKSDEKGETFLKGLKSKKFLMITVMIFCTQCKVINQNSLQLHDY